MTTATKKVPGPGRGGKREGAGRKSADGVTIAGTVQVIARVTPDQRKRFLKLGGSAWLRAVIDREFGKEFDLCIHDATLALCHAQPERCSTRYALF